MRESDLILFMGARIGDRAIFSNRMVSPDAVIVHIDVEADQIPEAAESIVNIDGVTEVYSITGDWDLIAMVRVSDHEKLAAIISDPERYLSIVGEFGFSEEELPPEEMTAEILCSGDLSSLQ